MFTFDSLPRVKRVRKQMNVPSIHITSLSGDVHTLISSFLDTRDAIMYSQTCKQIRHALDFQVITNVNVIQYEYYNMNQSSSTSNSLCLCRELIPNLPSMVGKHAMHSYRIRCDYEDGDSDNQTFFIKNNNNDIVALFIVDCDNRDIILIPRDPDQTYFLCHHQIDDNIDESYKIKFIVDVLVHGLHTNKKESAVNLDVFKSPLAALTHKGTTNYMLQICEA